MAILDWNENVGRPTTSIRNYAGVGMDVNRQGQRVLVAKTFNFVNEIWHEYVDLVHQENGDRHVGDDVEAEEVDSDDDNDDLDDNSFIDLQEHKSII